MDSAAAGARPSSAAVWKIATAVSQGVLFLAYPFIVFFAYQRLDTRAAAGLLLCLYALSLAARIRGPAREVWALLREHLGLVLLIGLAMITGERLILQLLPIAVSLYLLATFGWSLRAGPPIVERMARLVDPDLPDFCVPYCRKVTIAWCSFLALNSLCIAWLAWFGPFQWWALYTGLVAYLLLGLLFAAEFSVRKLWFRYYREGLLDRAFARLFPAENTANGRRSLEYVRRRNERAATSANA
jgi:uncharacterized membrane protein